MLRLEGRGGTGRFEVSRRVQEFVEIRDYSSLDELIGCLTALRQSLPVGADAQLKLRGDDFFGRSLTIRYSREQTPEEVALERRYQIAELQQEIRLVA